MTAWSEFVGPRYGCIGLSDIDFSGSNDTVLNITGDHQEGQNHTDVEGLFLSTSELEVMPKNLDSFFPNLVAVRWTFGNLISISAEDLPFPNLRVLQLDIHRIVSLDGDAFQYTPLLQQFTLSGNRLAHVGYNTFSHLKNLESLDLLANTCINSIASTRQEVENLLDQLLERCPPLEGTTIPPSPTTDSGECEWRCSINSEIDELLEQTADMRRVIVGYEQRLQDHELQFQENEARFKELERLIRELSQNTTVSK